MKKRPVPEFHSNLTNSERILGFCFLGVHILLLPLLMGMMKEYLPGALSDAQWETMRYLVSFVLIIACLRPMMFRDWDRFCDNKLPCMLIMVPSHLVCIGLTLAMSLVVLFLPGDPLTIYDEMLPEFVSRNSRSMLVPLVFLAPIAEETLFRGVLFGSLREKNRVLAYIVSLGVYVAFSIFPYLMHYSGLTVVFYAMDVIPFAFALTWCYERTGTVWSPVLYHALYNLVTVLMQKT